MTQAALKLVQKENPDYVLAIRKLSDYYDMKLVTFAVDRDGDLVIVFPAFVQLFNRLPMSLYELETVKVPIFDRNSKADSYSEIQTSKPYIAFNQDYYIQLRIQELRQCKLIHQTYFCEELFLVNHKSKHSCESAVYFKLSAEIIKANCQFKYYYNITVTPSVLDGGHQIVLANMISEKKLVCSNNYNLAQPLPNYSYVLVNRSILCHCKLEGDYTYLLKLLGSCVDAKNNLTMHFTFNLAFMTYTQDILNLSNHIPIINTRTQQYFNFSLFEFKCLQGQNLLHQPQTLAKYRQCLLNDTSLSPYLPKRGLKNDPQ